MATKAGRAQFKDLVAGRVLWRVYAVQLPPGNIFVKELERVTVVEKPFRTFLQDVDGVCRPDWGFTVRYNQAHWDTGAMRVHDCSAWGIQTDVSSNKPIGLKFFFMTEAAACRYMDRLQNYRLADAFEHPRQFKKVELPRIRYLRPYQFVVGGVICDHTTPKKHIGYYMEQSRKELSMMYPNVIEPLKIPDLELMEWAEDPDAFKQSDPKTFYPGTVFIPSDLTPEARAQVEKDFVILDEVHQYDENDPTKFTRIAKEYAEKFGNNKLVVGYDPAGPSITSVTIGNGDVPMEDQDADMFAAAWPKVFKKED